MTLNTLDTLHQVSVIVALSCGALVMLLRAIGELRPRHCASVRTVWYVFSLACIATFLTACWAISKGWLDAQGKFQGEMGALINTLLSIGVDLEADFLFLVSVVSLLIVPQMLSYVLSGLCGCASRLWLVGGSMAFLVWGVVKSFAVTSGIVGTVVLVGVCNGWPGLSWLSAAAILAVSFFTVTFSFVILHMYYEAGTLINWVRDHCPERLIAWLRRRHEWATRHCCEP